MILDSLQMALCDMQGKLFVESGKREYDSKSFIKAFMTSAVSADLDKPFQFMQWSGAMYIMERMEEECEFSRSGNVYDSEVLYWCGYVYRYWHFYKKESSKDIYRQANAEVMNTVYLMYHTMAPELAIDRLKETYQDKHK